LGSRRPLPARRSCRRADCAATVSAGGRRSPYEARVGHHQAVQARRGARCPDGRGRVRPDGERGQGVRPPEGPDRDLSRRRIPGEFPAQGEGRDRGRRQPGRAPHRGHPEGGAHRQDRRRQDLRHPRGAGTAHPHRRDGFKRTLTGNEPARTRRASKTTNRKDDAGETMFGTILRFGAPLACVLFHVSAASAADKPTIDTGDTAWRLVASALVLMMNIPGLALFYAGMVRKKNVLATAVQAFAVAALVTVLWFIAGYSLAFTNGGALNGVIGSLSRAFGAGLQGSVHELAKTVPENVFLMYQATFAIITPAIIAGALAARMEFSAVMWFMALWLLFVYLPVAHWVWGGGFLGAAGVLDFAGGLVVHLNAGIAGLVCCLVIGKRRGYGTEYMAPHDLVLTLIGTSLLWVGWFGFNARSALPSAHLPATPLLT